jgi:AcrR family transcriptional regulator
LDAVPVLELPAFDAAMRKQPNQQRSRRLVSAVLDVIDELIRGEGYDALSVERVCQRAGIGPGSFYQYFSSQESAIVALLQRDLGEHWEGVISRIAGNTPSADPKALIHPFLIESARRIRCLGPLLAGLPPQLANVLKNMCLEFLSTRHQAASKAFLISSNATLRHTDLEEAIWVVNHAVLFLMFDYFSGKAPPITEDKFIDLVTDLVVRFVFSDQASGQRASKQTKGERQWSTDLSAALI